MELKKKEYGEYVEKITPKNSLPADMARAFLTGGAICSLGQAMIMGLMSLGGLEKETELSLYRDCSWEEEEDHA